MAPNVTLSFGPMLIGTFINMILYGVLVVQTYHYYLSYKGDAKWIKALVYYLFIVETLNTACDIQMMYQPLIQNFGEAEATKYFPMMFAAEPIVIVAVSTPIQFFFAWRVRLLTKSNWLGAIICLFALISLAGGIWTTALIIQVKVFARKIELHWSALVWFLAACISDVLITTVLVVTLSRRKTGFAATDDAIQRIIRMTVQTGALTAICAIGDVVFFMTMGHTALNFLWDLALSKLYANCLLSTLNARGGNFNKDGGNNNSSSPSGGTRNQRERGQLGGGATPAQGFIGSLGSGAGCGRQPGRMYANSGHGHSCEYELELGIASQNEAITRSFGEKSCSLHPRDLEYGITVTRVVETLEDPEPVLRQVHIQERARVSEYIVAQ